MIRKLPKPNLRAAHYRLRFPEPKRILINLNRDLDLIKERISDKTARFALPYEEPSRLVNVLSDPEYALTIIETAVLALEDRRFFLHRGIEARGVPRALKRLTKTGRLGGISTIEQQLVRTILERRERTIRRKLPEMLLSFFLVFHMSKRDILLAYLELCYLGYKIRGVDNASLKIFSKYSRYLSNSEAAFIASLLVYPIPNQVIETSIYNNLLPVKNIYQYLSEPTICQYAWARKVHRRLNYCIELIDNAT